MTTKNDFPDRLKSYRKGKCAFRIYVNAEFDKCYTLLIAKINADNATKSRKERKNNIEGTNLFTFLRESGIPLKDDEQFYYYIDRALKLLVVSTGNDDTSREITIGTDIKDYAEGYRYDAEYMQCIELYKHYGLSCDIDSIQFRDKETELSRYDRPSGTIPNQHDVELITNIRNNH